MSCELGRCYLEKRVTARRRHICCECHKDIKPGDTYSRITGLWDSGWTTYKMCIWCSAIRDSALRKYDGPDEFGPAFGQLHEWLRDQRNSVLSRVKNEIEWATNLYA